MSVIGCSIRSVSSTDQPIGCSSSLTYRGVCLGCLDMRRDVQEIFRATPTQKQVMMFSATLSQEIRPICKKFMQNPLEIYVDDETKLTLHGLQQYYIKLSESEKNRRLNELLDTLEFNQVIIFVKSTLRATELDKLLRECNFPSIAVHSGVSQEERCVAPNTFSIDRSSASSADSLAASNDTRNSRTSTSVSASLPTCSAEGSISSVSTWPSTTTCPRMRTRIFTVSAVQVGSGLKA